MPRPLSITKEKILAAAMDVVRKGGASALTPESLREEHPNLTRGDVRMFILSRLQFSVTEQALLLGISPASVTKARQRLKAKLGA